MIKWNFPGYKFCKCAKRFVNLFSAPPNAPLGKITNAVLGKLEFGFAVFNILKFINFRSTGSNIVYYIIYK